MCYISSLPDYPALEKIFNDAGYRLDVDLSNSLVIELPGEDEFINYDQLPEHLQKAMDDFAERNNLDN